MARTPSDPRRSATPRGAAPPGGRGERQPRDPAPVDLANESVAGEEDPGASAEPPEAPPVEPQRSGGAGRKP
jgi:hypothetical protein